MLNTCYRCFEDVAWVKSTELTDFGNPIYLDQLKRPWRIRWSPLKQILLAVCPICLEKIAQSKKSQNKKKRQCNFCKKPLPLTRRFNHQWCAEFRVRGNVDGDYVYHGYYNERGDTHARAEELAAADQVSDSKAPDDIEDVEDLPSCFTK